MIKSFGVRFVLCSAFLSSSISYAEWNSTDLNLLLRSAEKVDWTRATQESVLIHAPVSEVWAYNSDNKKAKKWSVYFDHISTIPADADPIAIGAVRRCFRNSNESGVRWDEVTIARIPNVRRQIYVYDLKGYRFREIADASRYFVTQVYEPVDAQTTRLTFLTVIDPDATSSAKIGFRFGESTTREIFKKNLENIKAAIESRETAPRPYPYEPWPYSFSERMLTHESGD